MHRFVSLKFCLLIFFELFLSQRVASRRTTAISISNRLHGIISQTFKPICASVIVSSTLLSTHTKCLADTVGSSQLREGIANSASKLPGFGQPDVFYPNDWQGNWKSTVTVTDVLVQNTGDDKAKIDLPLCIDRLSPGTDLSYVRTFIEYNGHVVRDRSNAADFKSKCGTEQVLSFWEPSNPNIQNIRLGNGKSADIQVTKRAIEKDKDTDSFLGFSEYSRILETSPTSMAPQVYASRTLARYKHIDADHIQGLERQYLYKSDTLDMRSDAKDALATVKFRIIMEREK